MKHITDGISLVANYGTQNDCDRLTALTDKIHSEEERDDLRRWLEIQAFRKQVKLLIAALKESLRSQSSSKSDGWLARRFKRS